MTLHSYKYVLEWVSGHERCCTAYSSWDRALRMGRKISKEDENVSSILIYEIERPKVFLYRVRRIQGKLVRNGII